MKIYTKTGDKGSTSLFGGEKISKSEIVLDVYGSLDELNSYLGLIVTNMDNFPKFHNQRNFIINVQKLIFCLGSFMSTVPDKRKLLKISSITIQDIEALEHEIDELEAAIPQLTSFIIPGGSNLSSIIQIARTVARRSEREMVRLYESNMLWKVENSIEFINRLSDFLFVLARYVNYWQGVAEVKWP